MAAPSRRAGTGARRPTGMPKPGWRSWCAACPMSEGGLRYGPLGRTCVHLCVDMQNLFGAGSRWETPWLPRVLPKVERLVAAHPDRTILTRFLPAQRPGEGHGTWKHYYERYADMTLDRLPPERVDLV